MTPMHTTGDLVVRDVMTTPPLALPVTASLEDAARLFASSEASDLMVMDDDGLLVGVLSEGDVIRAVLPNLQEVLGAGGSVDDAMAALVRKGRELAHRGVAPYLISDPITVAPTDHVGVAAAAFITRQIRRLPVVVEGRLVGTISRSDLARAVVQSGSA